MKTSQSPYVVDSSVVISLEHGYLIEKVFKLNISFLTTDLIFYEELGDDLRKILPPLGLKIEKLNYHSMSRMEELVLKYRKPSRIDISGLVLAEHRKTVLLTGDKNLRKAAENEGIEVHGVLYALELLIDKKIVTPEEAISAMDRMIMCKDRLPEQECNELRIKWSNL
jgi:predicted nucleic acid-binding protein